MFSKFWFIISLLLLLCLIINADHICANEKLLSGGVSELFLFYIWSEQMTELCFLLLTQYFQDQIC